MQAQLAAAIKFSIFGAFKCQPVPAVEIVQIPQRNRPRATTSRDELTQLFSAELYGNRMN